IYMPGRKPKYIGNTNMNDVYGMDSIRDMTIPLLIVGGHKDRLICQYFLRHNGVRTMNVVCLNGESTIPQERVMKSLLGMAPVTYAWYDNDRPGIKGLKALRKRYPTIK